MKEKKEKIRRYTVEDLREKGLILLEYISGSQMYGTSTPQSDVDHKGIFLLPDEDFSHYDYHPDWEEVESGKFFLPSGKECEMKFYELRKFIQLLEKNNPNSFEIFDIPEECIIYKHPMIDTILKLKKDFITKKSFQSFSGYALDQTSKAHGKNKKQNWEKERFERKTILDFCYVPHKQGSIPIKKWMENYDIEWKVGKDEKPGSQADYALAKIPHMPFTYGVYFGNGMTNESETSTALRVSAIEHDAIPLTTMTFNESAWSIHCDEYKSYQTWLAEKNEARWVDVKGHNQKIDGKNMLHMQRLINMAEDIANNKGIISRRPEARDLLKIRRGEVSLQELLDSCETKLNELKLVFDSNTQLPTEVDHTMCEELNNNIRKQFFFKRNEQKYLTYKK